MRLGRGRATWTPWAFVKRNALVLAIGWAVAAIVLGAWGWSVVDPAAPWHQDLYLSMQQFWPGQYYIPSPDTWQLALTRWMAPLLTLSAAIAAGLAIFGERVQRFRAGRMRGHTVVCGLGDKGYEVVKSLLSRGEDVAVVERDAENDYLPLVRQLGASAFVADAGVPAALEQAGVRRARRLVAVCSNDDMNVEIAFAALEVRQATRRGVRRWGRTKGGLRCLAHIDDLAVWRLLRERALSLSDSTSFTLEFFNFHDRAAEDVVKQRVLDESGASRPGVANVAVIGDSPVAARIRWHILAAAEHPPLFPAAEDPESIAIEGLLQSPSLLAESMPVGSGSIMLVAMASHRRTFHMALALEREYRSSGATVVACTRGASGIARAFAGAQDGPEGPQVQDLMDCLRDPDSGLRDLLDDLGREMHERWLAGKIAEGHAIAEEPRFSHWASLQDELRLSNLHAAADIIRKLRTIAAKVVPADKADASFRFGDEEIKRLARMEHERWVVSKQADGWCYGEVRDNARKVHDLMKPYDELSPEVQRQNEDEIEQIPELLGGCGLGIQREEQ